MVVRSVLIRFIIVKTIAQAVSWETSAHPSEEDIVWNVLLGSLHLEVVIVWNLIVCVVMIAVNMVVVATTSGTESSDLVTDDQLRKKS